MKLFSMKKVVWVLVALAALTPLTVFTVGQLSLQSDAVIIAGDDNGGQGGG